MNTKEQIGLSESDPRVTVEGAAVVWAEQLLKEFATYERDTTSDFLAYFVLDNEVHAQTAERFIAGLGLRSHPDGENLVVSSTGTMLSVHHDCYDDGTPYAVWYRSYESPASKISRQQLVGGLRKLFRAAVLEPDA